MWSHTITHSLLGTVFLQRYDARELLVSLLWCHMNRKDLFFSLGAAIASAVDYKLVMLRGYDSPNEEVEAYSVCHTRSARRVLKALLANGGGYHFMHLCVLINALVRYLHQTGTAHSFFSSPPH